MAVWFVFRDGAQHAGPLSTEELLRGLVGGAIPRDVLIHSPGEPGWTPVDAHPAFAGVLENLRTAAGAPQPASASPAARSQGLPTPEPSSLGGHQAPSTLRTALVRGVAFGAIAALGVAAAYFLVHLLAGQTAPRPAVSAQATAAPVPTRISLRIPDAVREGSTIALSAEAETSEHHKVGSVSIKWSVEPEAAAELAGDTLKVRARDSFTVTATLGTLVASKRLKVTSPISGRWRCISEPHSSMIIDITDTRGGEATVALTPEASEERVAYYVSDFVKAYGPNNLSPGDARKTTLALLACQRKLWPTDTWYLKALQRKHATLWEGRVRVPNVWTNGLLSGCDLGNVSEGHVRVRLENDNALEVTYDDPITDVVLSPITRRAPRTEDWKRETGM